MITVTNVSKSFGKFAVLEDISFDVQPLKIYGLIGYNGVGKTTLLKIMAGIYRADCGTVAIDGKTIYENQQLKRKVFLMTEEIAFFTQATLLDMRRFYKGYYPKWSDKTFYGLIQVFGVDAKMKIARFSKGMQRQAGLILAFATHAQYLLLDEAFDGLDFTIRKLMRHMLTYYIDKYQAHIVISSHNLRELDGLADEIGMLSDGKLIYNNSSIQMKQDYKRYIFTDSLHREMRFFKEHLSGVCLIEQTADGYMVIAQGTEEVICRELEQIQCTLIHIRPINLEEFFYKERREVRVDWQEIF